MLTYWQLWAKTSECNRWHALPFHLLDVAAAAEVLWDRLPHEANAVATQASGDELSARRICVFFAAAHDIGKANRFFQAKDHSQHRRLRELGTNLPPYSPDDNPRHGQATGAHLKSWFIERWKWTGPVAENVALAIGGHHGSFFPDTKRTPLGVDREPWCGIGMALLDDLAKVLLGAGTATEPDSLNPFLGWISGFVSVADWLGSHETMTVWQTGERSFADYLGEARSRAKELLDRLDWQVPPATTQLPVAELLPSGSIPNSLQEVAETLASDVSLAIIEAPTGEGKTEAAFALAEPVRSAGAGIYFALPTMATANGLYGRVETYLRKATGNNDLETRLLHSHAWLFRQQAETAQDPGEEGKKQESQAQDWFAGAKRGLLAPFAVGTIDQALIAALRAKHGFVRLFALAGKTVVIDEVHAYDVYMADVMNVLLGWLRALRCRVILLSATLPNARRKALLKAWGCCGGQAESGYPCITWVAADGQVQWRGIVVQPRKPLTFRPILATDEEHWKEGAALVLQLVRAKGGLGALVLNTVRDAQQAYDWLRGQALDNIGLDLFHARFTARHRDDIEKRVLDRFGKTGPRKQPAILVATQVVEQSLDLDFDHMVSALAPIDLLIQRAGRLHRHRRQSDGSLLQQGADERPDPVLHILAPPLDQDGVPAIRDPVYNHDVLMRTLRRLGSNVPIVKPSDVAGAIEAIYGEADRAAALSAWDAKLMELEARTDRETQLQRQEAGRATIPHVDNVDKLIVEAGLDLDENDERQGSQLAARTRLEDRPSITVALLRDEQGCMTTIHGSDPMDPREAMFACVRISPPYQLWETLLALEPLPAWRRRGALSRVRPLILARGRTRVPGYEICYDVHRGLDWRKADADI
jgi:CRISPR-associated endonuclease/helicase Cas3